MLAEGDRAPAFTLPDQNGDKVKLSDLKGQTVVLYFYPKANTPAAPPRPAASVTARRITRPPGRR